MTPTRRWILRTVGSTIGAALPVAPVFSAQECRPSQLGMLCSSYIPLQRLTKIYAFQGMSEWCWAASISMIFAYNDHPVSQARIVGDAYGSIANVPGSVTALFAALDRTWQDDSGNDFRVAVNNLFSPDLGISTVTNADLIQELEDEKPIIYCTAQHAMVLTSMSYVGAQVVDAWVMDPWPGNGLRRLSPVEMVPITLGAQLRMAATLDIS